MDKWVYKYLWYMYKYYLYDVWYISYIRYLKIKLYTTVLIVDHPYVYTLLQWNHDSFVCNFLSSVVYDVTILFRSIVFIFLVLLSNSIGQLYE